MSASTTTFKVKWAITLLLPILISLIPISETFNVQLKIFFVITALSILVIAFELLDYMMIAILLPGFYVAFKIAPLPVVYGGWSSTMAGMIIGGFILANVLDRVGLLSRIAYWGMLKVGGGFKQMIYGIFLIGLIIHIMISCNGAMLIFAFCYGICRALGYSRTKEAAAIMIVGAIAINAPQQFIFQPIMMSLIVNNAKTIVPEFSVTYLQVLTQNIPAILFIGLIVFLIAHWAAPKDGMANSKSYFQEQYQALGEMTGAEKKAGIVSILVILYMLTSGWHGLDIAYGFIFIPWLLFLPGINIGVKEDIKNINFESIFFIFACMSIGSAAAYIGLGVMLSALLVPTLTPLGPVAVIGVIWFIGVLLNVLLTPVAVIGAFTAPITQVITDLGMNPLGPLYTLLFSMDQVFFPYENVQYLIPYTFGVIAMKDFIKIMSTKVILSGIFVVAVMVPWWYFVGLL